MLSWIQPKAMLIRLQEPKTIWAFRTQSAAEVFDQGLLIRIVSFNVRIGNVKAYAPSDLC